VITDTASYSDIVFGLFAICGYQFSPLLADITDTRLWRFDLVASYGSFDQLSRHRHPACTDPRALARHAPRRRLADHGCGARV
jgi:TnpA family transposase